VSAVYKDAIPEMEEIDKIKSDVRESDIRFSLSGPISMLWDDVLKIL